MYGMSQPARRVLLLFAVFFVLLGPRGAFAESVSTMPAQPSGYITDDAHVLSDPTKASLESYCRQIDLQAHAQIFVAIINKIDGDVAPQDFAQNLFERWHPGNKGHDVKSNRGILMLFSIQDRKRWISTGYGLEGILPDGKVGDIGRSMVPLLQAADYDGAVTKGVTQVGGVIAQDAGVTVSLPAQQHQYHRETVSQPVGTIPWPIRILGLIFLVGVLVFLFGRGGGGGGGGGGFWLWLLLDSLLSNGRRGGGDGFSGGFGGGDSDGGGGFDGGGGGDSGGGGAGGNW